MKRLFLDCQMGIAGDMLIATLLGLVDNPEIWIERLNQIGIPNVTYTLIPKEDKGLQGYRVAVTIDGIEESEHHTGSSHDQHHTDHHHHVHGRGLQGVTDIINSLSISDTCKQNAINVYNLVAQAEAKVHKSTVTQIHFHELGMLDAIADIVAVCVLLEELNFDEIIISPIHVGTGTVHCAHGELPVPAPATMELLSGIPMYADYQIKGEFMHAYRRSVSQVFWHSF